MAPPRRTCVGCRRVAPQDELVRVVSTGDGGLQLGRKLPGRGAWLCPNSPACLELARRRLPRALRAEVRAEAVERLRSRLT